VHSTSKKSRSRSASERTGLIGRWCRNGATALAVWAASSSASFAEIAVALVDGSVAVTGLAAETLSELRASQRDFEAWTAVLQVSVSEEAPPILGEYEVTDSVLRFHPMFPFDPGKPYSVRFELEGTVERASVALPAADRTPTTFVSEIYPTTDTLPENQLKLYIHFSGPMAGGDGLRYIRLLDEDGNDVVDPFLPLGDAFWDRERRRYTVFFDPGRVKQGILPNEQMGRPILDGREYTLFIDHTWRDEHGNALTTPFEKRFTTTAADESAIDPDHWTLNVPRAGTLDPLVLDFSESLDHGLLMRALRVENVPGTVEVSENESRWAFTPEQPWQAGDHAVEALTILEDLAGNQIGKPFEVDMFERIETPEDQAASEKIPFVIR